jgi:hypothetical protein
MRYDMRVALPDGEENKFGVVTSGVPVRIVENHRRPLALHLHS